MGNLSALAKETTLITNSPGSVHSNKKLSGNIFIQIWRSYFSSLSWAEPWVKKKHLPAKHCHMLLADYVYHNKSSKHSIEHMSIRYKRNL